MSISLASILRLGFYPDVLLRELDQMGKLSILNSQACIRLLEALVNFQRQNYDPQPETTKSVINKLHEQIALQQSQLNSRSLTRIFYIMSWEARSPACNQQELLERAQVLVDKFGSLLSRRHAQIEFNHVFFANKFAKEIQVQLRNASAKLDMSEMIAESCHYAEQNLESMSPKQLTQVMGMFDDTDVQSRLVKQGVRQLKTLKVDIKQFEIGSLVDFMKLVAKHSPKDLITFYKYVQQPAIVDQLNSNFVAQAELYVLLAE